MLLSGAKNSLRNVFIAQKVVEGRYPYISKRNKWIYHIPNHIWGNFQNDRSTEAPEISLFAFRKRPDFRCVKNKTLLTVTSFNLGLTKVSELQFS